MPSIVDTTFRLQRQRLAHQLLILPMAVLCLLACRPSHSSPHIKSSTLQVPLGIVLLIRDGHILLQLVLMVDQGQLLIEQLRLGQYVLIGVGEDVAVIRIMTVVQVLLVR